MASANKVIMLENSIYSVISPEGCASILWRDQTKSLEAAKAMKLTANELLKIKIIDEIIDEPVGGAHRNKEEVVIFTKKALKNYLDEFKNFTRDEILEHRKNKFLEVGKQKTFQVFSKDAVWTTKENFLISIKSFLMKFKRELFIILFLVFVMALFLIK